MANFRLLGNTLIDFGRVRCVMVSEGGLRVRYNDGAMDDFVEDNGPEETLKQFYADALKQDERLPLTEALGEHCH